MFYSSAAPVAEETVRKLQVKIGPSIEHLQLVNPNCETDPHFVDSPYFTGNVLIRIKDFNGVTPNTEDSLRRSEEYFENKKRLFALQLSCRFKHEYSLDDIVFGSEFEKKTTPPTGSWVAMKFATMIDAALQSDIYADKPWVYSPMLCSMNFCNVVKATEDVVTECPIMKVQASKTSVESKQKTPDSADFTGNLLGGPDPKFVPSNEHFTSVQFSKAPPNLKNQIGPWLWKDGNDMTENTVLLQDSKTPLYDPNSNAERRKYYQKEKHRKAAIVSPEKVHHFEVSVFNKIFAPFIDLNSFNLSLGINVNLLPYLNGQPLRMMAKSKSLDRLLFVIEFNLVTVPKQ